MTLRNFLCALFLTILFTAPKCVDANLPLKDDEKVIIENSTQKLEFFLDKKKELKARLSVKITAVSKTNLAYTFGRTISFTNNSKVGKIVKKADRKTRKVEPIISDYESDGIFHSDLKICSFDHKFYGADERVEISYEKVFLDLKFLENMYFNDYYQVDNSTVIIEVPDWMKLDIREWNFDKEKPNLKVTDEKGKKIYTYNMKDLPGAFRYSGEPSRINVNAHLILIPNSYKSNGKTVKLIEDVGDLYSWYASLAKQIGNNPDDLKTVVTKLTAGKTDDLEKIKSIFYWVQDNIKYIAYEYGIMGFKPESCQKVLGNKYGDCKGMANLTKEMLTIAGYDARLTWIGTRDIPYSYDVPSLYVDNHMICTVILNNEKIFLDATEKFADLYKYAYRIQGKQVLIENGDDYIIETVPTMDIKSSKEVTTHVFSLSENTLKGKGKITFTGGRKSSMLYYLSKTPEEDWEKYIKNYIGNGDKNIQINLLTAPGLEHRDKELGIEYEVSVDNHIISLDNELYVNPEVDYHFRKYDMPKERTVAYQFPTTRHIEIMSTIDVPAGWKVTYLPDAINVKNDNYHFSLSYKSEDGKVIYNKKIEITNTLLNQEDFKEWNKVIEQLNTFYSDQIILSK